MRLHVIDVSQGTSLLNVTNLRAQSEEEFKLRQI